MEEKSTPVLNVAENLVNVSLDSERTINTIFISNQKDIDDNLVNKNGINGKRQETKNNFFTLYLTNINKLLLFFFFRKLPSSNLGNSKLRKIFVHMSRYNIECFRKIDFSSDKKWSAFLRYVAYNRHQNKVLAQQNRRLQKKMYILQDMLEDLM